MSGDEEGTLARLKAHRKALIDPKIAEHGGRIIKTTGDGMLVEFASVVDAVRCVVEIQRGMLERNADIPVDKRIDFRVGINVGDVIVDGDDIYGDGVNVAARLEGLAEPGGILVAGVGCKGRRTRPRSVPTRLIRHRLSLSVASRTEVTLATPAPQFAPPHPAGVHNFESVSSV